MVFVKPYDSGELPRDWAGVFDSQQSHLDQPRMISAIEHPRAQRILAAIMGVELVGKVANVDPKRVYIAGMSGGGRIASQTITRFPEHSRARCTSSARIS